VKKATTFRIEPVAMEGLTKLGTLLKKPLNKLANEAVREYVARRTHEVEVDLASTLEDLRAYRKRDPNFEQSISKFIEAEVSAKSDPAEGRVVSKVSPSRKTAVKLSNA
jgi:hypothetical protein